MKYTTTDLLEALYKKTEATIQQAITEWQQLPVEFFNAQPGLNKWSAAQCLEHLNSYGRYYLPAIEKTIMANAATPAVKEFSSSWLGNYFYRLMQTDEKGITKKKMKAPSNHRPPAQLNAVQVLSNFISQQERLLQLITKATNIDINRAKVPISIAPFIQLKLGDTFLFYITHIERHMQQAARALKMAGYLPPPDRASQMYHLA